MTANDLTTRLPSDCGLLLVGHGSQDKVGHDEFLATARMVARRAPHLAVEPCFLEFAEPSIAAGFRALVRRGTRRIVVVPLLLFAAGHAKRDIPAAVAAVAAEYPRIDVRQSEHLGCHGAMLELSRKRYEQALAGKPTVAQNDTALVLVGRGSRDSDATAEMLRFAALRAENARFRDVRACFLAMALPRVEDTLAEVAATAVRRIVVEPHLLFGGVLLRRIGHITQRFAAEHPEIDWLLTEHLGPSEQTAVALLCRASEKLTSKIAQY